MLEQEKINATGRRKVPNDEAMQSASMELPRFDIPSFTSFMLPSAFRDLAEDGAMRGKGTLETLGAAAQETYSASVKGLDACGHKIMEAGRNNAQAAFDCCRELVAAKSQSELLEAWSNHTQRQLDTMLTLNKEILALAWKVAADVPQPLMTSISETFARWRAG